MKQRLFILALAIALSVWASAETANAGSFDWWTRLAGKALLVYLLIATNVWCFKIVWIIEENLRKYDERDHKNL